MAISVALRKETTQDFLAGLTAQIPRQEVFWLARSDRSADMRVVDIYRREGDKIAENWVLIDLFQGFINRVSTS